MKVPAPWRALGVAAGWVLLSVALSLAAVACLRAVVAWLTGAADPSLPWWHQPDPVTAVLVAGFCGQGTLLAGAIRQALRTGNGDVDAGLSNLTMRHPWLVPLLAVATVISAGTVILLVHHISWLGRAAEGITMPFLQTLPGAGPVRKLVTVVLVAALAPIAEELFFRGWLWTALRRSLGPILTAVATSLFWLSLHAPDGLIRPLLLLPMAIILAAARHFTGSVRGPIMVHIFNNAMAVSALLSVK